MKNYNKMPLYKPEDSITLETVGHIYTTTIENEESSPYLYKDKDLTQYFNHRNSKNGSRFYDGNNGDSWRVIYRNPYEKRMLVQNISQYFIKFIEWDN